MRTFCNILSMALAALLAACNPDVFIKDFLPETPEITMEGGEASVDFKADNWGILAIFRGSMVSSAGVFFTVYDLEGKASGRTLPLKEEELAVVSVGDELHDFRIEKRGRRRLDLFAGENMEDNAILYQIVVGNDYEHKMIKVTHLPSRKYQVDSVAYLWDMLACSDNGLKLVRTMVVDNTQSSQPVTAFLQPYLDAYRVVSCSFDGRWSDWTLGKLFGEDKPVVVVPDIVDGKPALEGTGIAFGKESQALDAGFDKDLTVPVTIDAGEKRRIETYLRLEEYFVPFKAYVSNPQTGKERILTGLLRSERPFGHLVLKSEMDNG